MIPALATDGPRQRVAESALERCHVRTVGERGRRSDDGEAVPRVVVTLEYPGRAGKLYVRLHASDAETLQRSLAASIAAARGGSAPHGKS